MEQGISKQEIINELTRSAHAKLDEYIPVVRRAATHEQDFLAHFIAHDARHGSVRDIQTALPIISLAVKEFNDPELIDNSLAHLAKLTPRELRRAFMFAHGYARRKEQVPNPDPAKAKRYPKVWVGGWRRFGKSLLGPSRRKKLDALVARYLQKREDNPAEFERNLVNFREDIAGRNGLYRLSHAPMGDIAQKLILRQEYDQDSALWAIQHLEFMEPRQAAAAIVQHKIPYLSLFPILKKKVKDPILLMAVIDQMSASELQTNLPVLERLGVKDFPETRAALDAGLVRLAGSRKTVLKTSKAAERVEDQALKDRLGDIQEKQIKRLGGIDGNWLVLADRSGSMSVAIETARMVSGILAKLVKGTVALVFFDTTPLYYDVTGKTLEQIREMTKRVGPAGSTSIGCGVRAAMDRNLDVQGIAVVSDGEENCPPLFVDQYQHLCNKLGKDIPVYFYHVSGSGQPLTRNMAERQLDMETFNLKSQRVDEYSLVNLVQSMSVNRYSLIDRIMDSRLLTTEEVLGARKERIYAA